MPTSPISNRRSLRAPLVLPPLAWAVARLVLAGVVLAGVVFAGGGVARAEPLSLEAYVARAAVGLEARATAARVGIAEAEVEATGLWPNPSAEVFRQQNAEGVRAGESQDQLVLSLPLAVSGRLGLLRDAAAKDADAARHRAAAALGRLRHRATAAFLDVVALRRRAAAEREVLQALEPIEGAIAAREKAGEAAGWERVRIELERRRVEDALAAVEVDAARALARAQALLGDGAATVDQGGIDLADLDFTRPLAAAVAARDVEALREARALCAEVDAARLADEAGGRGLIPEPVLFGGPMLLDLGRPQTGVGFEVGVEVPLPTFDRGQGVQARARARRVAVEAELRAFVHTARVELAAARREVELRVERARQHDAQVLARATELRAITLAAYERGGAELLLLVDAERAQREAMSTSVALHVAGRLAENDLLLLSGAYDDPLPGSTSP